MYLKPVAQRCHRGSARALSNRSHLLMPFHTGTAAWAPSDLISEASCAALWELFSCHEIGLSLCLPFFGYGVFVGRYGFVPCGVRDVPLQMSQPAWHTIDLVGVLR